MLIIRFYNAPGGIPSRGRSAGAMKLGWLIDLDLQIAEACYSRDQYPVVAVLYAWPAR